MKKRIHSKAITTLGLLTSLIAISFFFASCGNPGAAGGTDVKCMTLSKAQIQTWVSAGYTRPGGTDEMKWILFNTVPTLGVDTVIWAIPVKGDGTFLTAGRQKLSALVGCYGTISFKTAIVNNFILFSKLGITDGNGNLLDFDYIKLTPQNYQPDPTYLDYDVAVVKSSGSYDKGSTDPCPPLCPF